MTTTDWIIDIVLVLIVLRQIREERLTPLFVAIPAALVTFTAVHYVRAVPASGHNLVLVIGLALAGVALGVAGGVVTRVRRREDHATVQAGPAAAGIWVASMSARLAFIIWITHEAGGRWLTDFSRAHDITGATVWQTALVLFALSEVVFRIGIIVVRGRLAVRTAR